MMINGKQSLDYEMSKGQAQKGLSGWWRILFQYIIIPPLVEQCEKQQWYQDEAKRRNEGQRREMLFAARSILESRQRQRLLTDEDVSLKQCFDEEVGVYKKNTKAGIRKLFQRLLGEFIGTFMLVFCCASMRVESVLNRLTSLENALGQGLLLVALIYSLGGICGAHFNPVVTLAFTLRGSFPIVWLPLYNIIQLTAAISASGVIRALYREDSIYATNALDPQIISSNSLGFGWETINSFFLIFVVLQTATRGSVIGPLAALAVGSINALNGIIGNISSSSMNPARTLGPAIINSSQDDRASLWIYIVGPYLGGVIAVVFVTALNWGTSLQEDNLEEMMVAQGESK